MQTILGAGGSIGKELAAELTRYSTRIRLVSRHPKKINETDELLAADLQDARAVDEAVKGSEVVYLVAGLQYRTKTWQEQWPVIMQNVISACISHKSKLVFFDNIYMYDPARIGHMTEETPINPSSKKGKVRAAILEQLMTAIQSGQLTGMVVRSADFYGPGSNASMLIETVYKNLSKGKKAFWIGNPGAIHSYTFIPDAAKATALLGNTSSAYNQVWHLPTDPRKLNGKNFVELFEKEMGSSHGYRPISKTLISIMGIFNPLMRELKEMMYQFERDYYFDSSKFRDAFPQFHTTTYEEGIKQTIKEANG